MEENLYHYCFRSKHFDLYMNVPDKHVMIMSSSYQFVAKCNNVLKNCFFFYVVYRILVCMCMSSCMTRYLGRDEWTASGVRPFE